MPLHARLLTGPSQAAFGNPYACFSQPFGQKPEMQAEVDLKTKDVDMVDEALDEVEEMKGKEGVPLEQKESFNATLRRLLGP